MSGELHDLLNGIGAKVDLISAWTVEVGPGGSSVRVETRRSFARQEDAMAAARMLLDELVRSSRRRVRVAVPGAMIDEEQDRGQEWRGVVDVELAPL